MRSHASCTEYIRTVECNLKMNRTICVLDVNPRRSCCITIIHIKFAMSWGADARAPGPPLSSKLCQATHLFVHFARVHTSPKNEYVHVRCLCTIRSSCVWIRSIILAARWPTAAAVWASVSCARSHSVCLPVWRTPAS